MVLRSIVSRYVLLRSQRVIGSNPITFTSTFKILSSYLSRHASHKSRLGSEWEAPQAVGPFFATLAHATAPFEKGLADLKALAEKPCRQPQRQQQKR
jgi:hypothetical protein